MSQLPGSPMDTTYGRGTRTRRPRRPTRQPPPARGARRQGREPGTGNGRKAAPRRGPATQRGYFVK